MRRSWQRNFSYSDLASETVDIAEVPPHIADPSAPGGNVHLIGYVIVGISGWIGGLICGWLL